MAKRTRRERRLDIEKQKPVLPQNASVDLLTAEVDSPVLAAEEFTPAPVKTPQAAPAINRKDVALDFAREYYYVYNELSTIFIITAIMFAVMIGLSFTI